MPRTSGAKYACLCCDADAIRFRSGAGQWLIVCTECPWFILG